MKLKPLFKWTGGKNKMKAKYGDTFFPDSKYDTFIDCFYGAGAVSHWILEKKPDTKFIINDHNSEMVKLYKTLRDYPDEFIDASLKLQEGHLSINTIEDRKAFYNYHKLRHCQEYENLTDIEEAAALYYMLRVNFNGWWKIYNYSNGRYATPPGTMTEKKPFMDVQNLKNTSKFFKEQCTILSGDFENVRPYVTDTSYVYFDPPYRDSTTNYTDDGFNENDQIRLCNFFKECTQKGALSALSNKEIGDGFFETHLGEYNLHKMEVKYSAGRGDTINKVQEILVTNFKNIPNTLF